MQRVLRPRVPRVSPPELAPERRVVPAPEAGQVLGHLDGALVGREQMKDQRNAPARQGRSRAEPEEILQP